MKLRDFRGKPVVLCSYSMADAPHCTTEACGFRDRLAEYVKKGIPLLGVSPNRAKTQAKSKTKHSLPFTLLADADHKTSERYGVWGLKKSMGREYMGAPRTPFLINERGRILRVFE